LFVSKLHCREGRNELQIGHVKDVLVSMRRTQSYQETKMRLLQKLFGMTWLGDAFEDEEKDPREWFNGSFRYHDYEEIVDLYVKGSPISCAASKADQPITIWTNGLLDVRSSRRDHRSKAREKQSSVMAFNSCVQNIIKFVLYLRDVSMMCTMDVCIFWRAFIFYRTSTGRPPNQDQNATTKLPQPCHFDQRRSAIAPSHVDCRTVKDRHRTREKQGVR
jgi:hypothetical protein